MPQVTIFYLQMTDASQLRGKPSPAGLAVERVDPADGVPGAVNKRFYTEVGRGWAWRDRLVWTDAQWADYAEPDELTTWIAKLNGEEVGYAELQREADGDVQLVYFGLLPEFIGKGLGGAFLSRIVEIAWATPGTRRVWLHTCTGDHPGAKANYESRGFVVYDEQAADTETTAPGLNPTPSNDTDAE